MHEDLTSYDCIVFIIPVYPHNIYYKIINIIKIKNLVSTPIHLSYYPSLKMIEREREKVYSIPIWLFIYLYIYCLHCFSIILYIYITYLLIIVGTEGEVYCVRMYLVYLVVYCTVCQAHVISTSPSTLNLQH